MKVSRTALRTSATNGPRRSLTIAAAIGTTAALAFSGLVTTPAFAAPNGESVGTGTNSADFSPSLSVTPGFELAGDGPSTLDLTGTGYATKNAWNSNFGGAYVLFGVVTPKSDADPGSWGPSKQGVSGQNYDYAPGAGTNQTMVNYPGNETEPGVPFMDASGNWSGQIVIPGAQFTSQAGKQIDCLVQQCGVITIGAHGSVQGGVEVFTPVTFAQAAAITAQPSDQVVTAGGDATFTVTATGNPAPSYQWQSRASETAEFANVAGATEASLTLPQVASAATGTQVRVIVTNDAGSVTSAPAQLTVNDPATATTTTLATQVSESYPTDFAGKDVALNATVAPAEAAGTVEFFVDGTAVGSAPVAEGAATLTTQAFTGGAHQVKSVFTPADAAVYERSESGERTFRIVDLTPAVSAIALGTKTQSIADATFNWSVANWVSFGSGPAKTVVSGDNVALAPLPEGATVNDRANQNFVFSAGTGFEDAQGNRVVNFTGEVQLTSGSIPRWTFTNPAVHTNAAGDGYITAETKIEYLGSVIEETDEVFTPGRIVVSTFTGGTATGDGATTAFTATPLFEGQVAAGTWNAGYTGATFTNEFLRHVHAGVRSFLLQTGTTGSNLTKPAQPISLTFAATTIAAPKLSVQPATGLARTGADVTVSGTDFDASAQTMWGTPQAAGLYVSLGWIANSGWKPSENAASGTRVAVATRWVQETEASGADYVRWTRDANDRASFSFTFPGVTYDAVMAKKPTGDYRLAVFAIGAGGVRQAINESAVDVAFAAAPPVVVPFTDVPKGHKFFTEIAWMYSSKLTTGVEQSNGTVKYLPKQNMTREAMAAFLYRAEGAKYVGPKVSPFADVKPGDKFYNEITWMYQQGLSTGIAQASGKPKYAPKSSVTREAMAAFMYRLQGATSGVPKVSPFVDVKSGDKFAKEIAWMYSSKLSTGVEQASGKPKYLPKSSVTREAMAAFLYRMKS
ncbi:S-layer homology domain-containing protein [Leucobacter luti]|uniref:S-layer homology domain-containing protein n=1 Tax=Leucobacter luti TaxID=340320 RepID=UPI001C68D762|nr:S-layer homology domain-containing protein [Leucobacter luti]QYM77027.1 S-layer homology domain-containing protein [Leucobacter luti]